MLNNPLSILLMNTCHGKNILLKNLKTTLILNIFLFKLKLY